MNVSTLSLFFLPLVLDSACGARSSTLRSVVSWLACTSVRRIVSLASSKNSVWLAQRLSCTIQREVPQPVVGRVAQIGCLTQAGEHSSFLIASVCVRPLCSSLGEFILGVGVQGDVGTCSLSCCELVQGCGWRFSMGPVSFSSPPPAAEGSSSSFEGHELRSRTFGSGSEFSSREAFRCAFLALDGGPRGAKLACPTAARTQWWRRPLRLTDSSARALHTSGSWKTTDGLLVRVLEPSRDRCVGSACATSTVHTPLLSTARPSSCCVPTASLLVLQCPPWEVLTGRTVPRRQSAAASSRCLTCAEALNLFVGPWQLGVVHLQGGSTRHAPLPCLDGPTATSPLTCPCCSWAP